MDADINNFAYKSNDYFAIQNSLFDYLGIQIFPPVNNLSLHRFYEYLNLAVH